MSDRDLTIPVSPSNQLTGATATASAEASLGRYVRDDDRKPLFHYTSPIALVSMLKESDDPRIYATNIRYLNDSSEYVLTRDLFVSRLTAYLKTAEDEDVASYLGYLERNTGRDHGTDGDFYVVSLSANGDELGQWRGYCPPDGGYSVGFEHGELLKAAKNEIGLIPGPWKLVECEYEAEIQIILVDSAIASSVEAFHRVDSENENIISKYFRGEIEKFPEVLARRILDLDAAIESLAPVLKHSAFVDEEEWRLISPRIIDGDPNVHFRGGRFSVIPFVYFDMPPIRQVIVGPSSLQDLSARAIAQLTQVPIPTRSKIPLRVLQ